MQEVKQKKQEHKLVKKVMVTKDWPLVEGELEIVDRLSDSCRYNVPGFSCD